MSDLKYIIRKSTVSGELKIPPSKSITHRMAICAALAEGTSMISNPLISDDIKATVDALKALGAHVHRFDEGELEIEGGLSGKEEVVLDCGESGSTLRFMLPLAAALGGRITFTGKGRLPKRKIKDLIEALRGLGASIDSDSLPLTVSGKIKPGKIQIRGDVSSQFVSGLLFALPLLDGESTIELTTELQSKPYVILTIDALERFGLDIGVKDNYRRFIVYGNQKLIPGKFFVDGDYSSASFMIAAGALCGDLLLKDLRIPSMQGDSKAVEILQAMGAQIEKEKGGLRVKKSSLKGIEIDARDIPDAVPILAVVATQAEGKTRIFNAERLRDKESDRLAAIASELQKMGAKIAERPDGLEIEGPITLKGVEIDTHGDHRIAMACSVAGLVADGETIITNPECVKKSYPDFFRHLEAMGAEVLPTTNVLGKHLRISVYGSSHGRKIGVRISGVPAGLKIGRDFIQTELEKRRSYGALTTTRREKDEVMILAGIENDITTGKDIEMEIENKDVRSRDYEKIRDTPRPGHADYTARVKYGGGLDMRGGGFFSGRMTACSVMAGAVAKKLLEQQGIQVMAFVKQIGDIALDKELTEAEISKAYGYETRCPDPETSEKMKEEILKAKEEGDSVGGMIECRITGVPAGLGEPLFDSVESVITHAVFSIPAVKGIEFGSGFSSVIMRGSEHNDRYKIEKGLLITGTNNAGGALGGISTGMPIVFRVALKPTSSIDREQKTVDLKSLKETKLKIEGRHDPCIALRAPVVVESMAALTLADLLLRWKNGRS
jgi:3-phosphoshikimate 1-carboxyvinyltransferase